MVILGKLLGLFWVRKKSIIELPPRPRGINEKRSAPPASSNNKHLSAAAAAGGAAAKERPTSASLTALISECEDYIKTEEFTRELSDKILQVGARSSEQMPIYQSQLNNFPIHSN